MTSWVDMKKPFQERYAKIQEYVQTQFPKDIETLSKSTARYISRGGISQTPEQNGPYNEAIQASKNIREHKTKFLQLNTDISKAISNTALTDDMGRLLLDNGKIQQDTLALVKEKSEVEEDAKSAELRDELLRTRESNITKHQLYMLGRPLRPSSIPYLWALSVFFVGLALIMFQQMSPPIMHLFVSSDGTSLTILDSLMGLLMDVRVWGILAGALAIAVVFLSLKVAKVI